MKIFSSALAFLVTVLLGQSLFAANESTVTYQVNPKDIHAGYVVEKIWLTQFAKPDVRISGVTYVANASLPADAKASDPANLEIRIGMERKRPFAIVSIPGYVVSEVPGQVNQVSGFTLTVTEQTPPSNSSTLRTTFNDVSKSVLAQGTWYKIAVTKTGFYKIDNSVLSAMGVTASSVNPAHIRVFGNGGNMLSENNAVSRPADLIENAVMLNGDNGDGKFDAGESVVFYAVGPTAWYKDSTNQRFYHQNNLYTDTAYYFVTFDTTAGLRISGQGSVPASNVTVNSFNYYAVHDTELINPVDLGKVWYGESFYPALDNTTQDFIFNIGTAVTSVYAKVVMSGTTGNSSGNTFNATLNGAAIGTAGKPRGILGSTTGDYVMSTDTVQAQVACNASSLDVKVNFVSAPDGSGVGYMNYIELNTRAGLTMLGDQMSFRDWQSVGAGNVANYQLQGATGSTMVWDVTNPQVPVLMNGSLTGSTYSFSQDASRLHEFAAMNDLNLNTPSYIGTVANQNLHGSGQVDLIIVTHPDFLQQANQLAAYHQSHDNMRVIVATPQQIYNEFSSGGQDISAIRDFARMFYERAGNDTAQMPSDIILFGGASYDYKNRVANNSNFVPVFESAESLYDLNAFSTDDFYGFLDNNEYIENDAIPNMLDIGVGRLPARSVADATTLVNKIIGYTQPATLGPWRIASTYVACINDDAGCHMCDAEDMASTVTTSTKNIFNEDKVYEDAIPLASTPAGARCPNANAEIDNDVFKGVFLINYNGHGNTEVWSSERILTEGDYGNWNNANMLPFMVTATCDFGQFDQPQFVSAASQLVLRPGGGVIAVLTTTEAVFAVYNQELNSQYLAAQCTRNADGSWNTFGAATRIGKNITYIRSTQQGEIANFRKFSLLGDPALTPTFPNYNITLDSINDGATLQLADTVKALGKYIISGSVRDLGGNLLSGFNGQLNVSFYDKPSTVLTITSPTTPFQLQQNIIYKGIVTVTNGVFTFEFITPLDINYYFGKGKISSYAQNGVTDAAGNDSSITVGGYSSNPVINTTPPVVRPYINDSLFLNGGITGANTSLFVAITSVTGINVSGDEIGHNLTAVLDGQVEAPYILNNYYQTAPNTYQRGYVTFPLTGLADGPHSMKVTAWDVNNNSGTGEVDFTVVDGQVVDIQDLGNYPNPFSNTTTFVFEHNHPNEALDVQLEIYGVSGALVKSINDNITPTDSRTSQITWDGRDNNGILLPSGVYIYRLNMTTSQGFKSSAYQKLVIVR